MEQKQLRNIMIVDDDADILTITKYAFEACPEINLKTVSGGEEALKLMLNSTPDLILLDLMMPGMDGATTLKAMRLIPTLAHVPVILFTARAEPRDKNMDKMLGIIGVILKPFDPLTLPQSVQDIWAKSASD